MKAEELAKIMHNEYESEAIKNNWKTQENCRVPFEDLPEENKQTMIAVAKGILEKVSLAALCAYYNWSDGIAIELFMEDFLDFLKESKEELLEEFLEDIPEINDFLEVK